jgi:hypothetical protein
MTVATSESLALRFFLFFMIHTFQHIVKKNVYIATVFVTMVILLFST